MRQRQQRQESLAKLLSYILSRRPDEFGLVLDEAGRLPVKELLWALAQEEGWGYVRRSHLEEVVNLVSPGAFELDKTYIRALQPGPAKLRSQESVWPPPLLYRCDHGQISCEWWRSGVCSRHREVNWYWPAIRRWPGAWVDDVTPRQCW